MKLTEEEIERYGEMVENIRTQLKKYLTYNDLQSLVLGVSGGLDSAVCAALAKPVAEFCGIPLVGATMPAGTNEEDETERAERVIRHLCHERSHMDVDESVPFVPYVRNEDGELEVHKVRFGNVMARTRMIKLYDLAHARGGMVLSTDNFTEYMLGFWTLHGDVGDYEMLHSLYKTEVFELAEYFVHALEEPDAKDVMQQIVLANPTDGLGVTEGGDLDQLLPDYRGSARDGYMIIDDNIKQYTEGGICDSKTVYDRIRATQFKRENPAVIPRSLIMTNNKPF